MQSYIYRTHSSRRPSPGVRDETQRTLIWEVLDTEYAGMQSLGRPGQQRRAGRDQVVVLVLVWTSYWTQRYVANAGAHLQGAL